MARVKRGVTSHAKHKKVLKAAKGYWPPQEHHPHRKAAVDKEHAICLPRPEEQEADVPCALDPASQRSGPPARHDLSPIYRWSRQGRDRDGSQGPVRNGHPRAGGFRGYVERAKAALPQQAAAS